MDEMPSTSWGTIRERFEGWKQFFVRYERRISSAALILGFVIDNIMFSRIDVELAALGLFGYIVLAGCGILLINLQEKSGWPGWLYTKMRPFLPPIVQFAFGALFSGFVIFYTRSGSLVASWPFLLILFGIFIGNEFFRQRYVRMTFHTSIYFLALFSFSIFVVPILVRDIGTWVFLVSGIVSIALILGFTHVLARLAPLRFSASRRGLVLAIAGIFIGMNVLYFTNSIPPIPLALREAGVYHAVVREGDTYTLTAEQRLWYDIVRPKTRLHLTEGAPASVFTSIFAPTDLNTNITHRWQYHNETTDVWETMNVVRFPIIGGRDDGYRAYSNKSAPREGDWRVDVLTDRGQLIGRIPFSIEYVSEPPQTETIRR